MEDTPEALTWTLSQTNNVEKIEEYDEYTTQVKEFLSKYKFSYNEIPLNDKYEELWLDDSYNLFDELDVDISDLWNIQKSKQLFHLKYLKPLCKDFSWQDPRENSDDYNLWEDEDLRIKWNIYNSCEEESLSYDILRDMSANFWIFDKESPQLRTFFRSILWEWPVAVLVHSVSPYQNWYFIVFVSTHDCPFCKLRVAYIFKKSMKIYYQALPHSWEIWSVYKEKLFGDKLGLNDFEALLSDLYVWIYKWCNWEELCRVDILVDEEYGNDMDIHTGIQKRIDRDFKKKMESLIK